MSDVNDSVTVKEAIKRADDLCPNVYPFSLKASWLYELDKRIYNDIFSRFRNPPEMSSCSYAENPDAVLLADRDFICLYSQHILVQCDIASGDSEGYANHSALFNKFYKIYTEYINRTYPHKQTRIKIS